MLVTLSSNMFGCFILEDHDGNMVDFVQSDWDRPGLAMRLGWQPCWCGHTDSTVDCEHKTVATMICEATDFLNSCDGETFEVYE